MLSFSLPNAHIMFLHPHTFLSLYQYISLNSDKDNIPTCIYMALVLDHRWHIPNTVFIVNNKLCFKYIKETLETGQQKNIIFHISLSSYIYIYITYGIFFPSFLQNC